MDNLQHRKSNSKIKITTADGTPFAGKEVNVDQTSHSFLFGCGAFEVLKKTLSENDPNFAEFKEKQTLRTEKWLELFNYGTLPFYWGNYEPEEGKPNEAMLMQTAKFLQERGVKTKGHPLCWHTVCADWLLKYSNEEIMSKQLARIQREVTNFKGVIDMWDVINEVVIMPVFDKYDNAVTRICKDKGRIQLVKEVFEMAKSCNPDATLLINDFNTSEAYVILLEGLLEAGVPITAIGIQSHQHQGFWGVDKIHDVLDRYSRFGLPIHFTENTLISGDLMPPEIVDLNDWQVEDWPSTPEGEARQAEEIVTMYRELFNHPLVEAITSWDFTDECWLNAPAGFLRKDSTEKPSYQALKNLIHGEWETHEKLVTDENGFININGFKGEYNISAEGLSAKVNLEKDTEQIITLA
jgi:GH35 family endo-1,4-beta-xylanase